MRLLTAFLSRHRVQPATGLFHAPEDGVLSVDWETAREQNRSVLKRAQAGKPTEGLRILISRESPLTDDQVRQHYDAPGAYVFRVRFEPRR